MTRPALVSLLLPASAALALAGGLLAVSSRSAQACGPETYMGTTCVTAADYCPSDMLPADGRTLPMDRYPVLFALIGRHFGGDTSTFKLPDLRGRTAVGTGAGANQLPVDLGTYRGVEGVGLTVNQLPGHTHAATFSVDTSKLGLTSVLQASAQAGASNVPSAANGYIGAMNNVPMWAATANNPVTVAGVSAAIGGGVTGGTVTNASTGAGTPVDIRPPSLGLTACIKVSGD